MDLKEALSERRLAGTRDPAPRADGHLPGERVGLALAQERLGCARNTAEDDAEIGEVVPRAVVGHLDQVDVSRREAGTVPQLCDVVVRLAQRGNAGTEDCTERRRAEGGV